MRNRKATVCALEKEFRVVEGDIVPMIRHIWNSSFEQLVVVVVGKDSGRCRVRVIAGNGFKKIEVITVSIS
ncbi:hypothetical protein PanWU01x14_044070 [Parasponia andersonii]|uniref:Uncharacterized protein n=1 Tax=Parasponia andersonii TaxID=3476 RepID=A0A2P5DP47_PARAD|nr:hypothetical protein PanWU01x14_044070 [Parasponia andersonii]